MAMGLDILPPLLHVLYDPMDRHIVAHTLLLRHQQHGDDVPQRGNTAYVSRKDHVGLSGELAIVPRAPLRNAGGYLS